MPSALEPQDAPSAKRRSPSKRVEPPSAALAVGSENENESENESESEGEGSILSASSASEGRAAALQRALSSDAILVRGLALAPVPVAPQQLSRATEIQLFLERVEFVEIRDVIEREEGIIYYVVDVYRYQQQKGLPTTRRRGNSTAPNFSGSLGPSGALSPAEAQERKPDYRIEQRYSSFARLRRNVAKIARKRHPHGRACAYCHSLLDHLEASANKPCLKVKFTASVDERKVILGTFLSELVFAVREGHTSCARSSHGYHIIPALVRRFLAEQTGNNFFRY